VNEVATTPASGGLLDDLLEIFIAPSRVFERRRASGYGVLLLVLMVLALAIGLATMGLTEPYWDAQFTVSMQQAAEKGQAMPPEAVQAGRAFTRWGGAIGTAIMLPIIVWIGALFVMLGAKVAGGSTSYTQSAVIVTLASFPRLLAPLIMTALSFTGDPMSIRSVSDGALGLARFVDPVTTSPVVLGVLANFELTNLWSVALMAIGISVIGRVSRGAGWVGAGVVFACSLALTIIPAAIF